MAGRSWRHPGPRPISSRALRKGFAEMAKDPAFLKDAERMKADIVVADSEEVTALYRKAYETPRRAGRARHRGVQAGRRAVARLVLLSFRGGPKVRARNP